MLVVPAHAKVNLALEVTARRPDGWHEIASVITTIDWHDLVGITLNPRSASQGSPRITLTVDGPHAEGVPADHTNLAHRAAARLLELVGHPPLDVHIWLCKLVPAAAGMGGGSADAAAVLRAGAARLRAPHLTPIALTRLAAELGSDVPALLHGGTTLATGRGEHLQPLPTPALHLAVAFAAPSATKAAYEHLTAADRRDDDRAATLARALTHHQPYRDDQLFGSALEPAACRANPALAAALQKLRAATPGTRWHLTGSGGAAFALAHDARNAQALAAEAARAGFPARACRTVATPLLR